jgi:hypothetical protein
MMMDIWRDREVKRAIRRGLVLGLLFMFAQCAYWTTYPLHAQQTDTIINHVLIDSVTAEWFARYRLRLDVEDTVCLYGFIRQDSAFVVFIKPTRTHNATPALVFYDTCPLLNPAYFGPNLMWLGGWHNHGPVFPGVDCNFSPLDDKSFFEQRAFIDLISCSTGLIARGRKK